MDKQFADLKARGDVEFATFNYRIHASLDPNDPYYNWQTALKQAEDDDIDAPEAWTLHRGPEVIIAVIDTG